MTISETVKGYLASVGALTALIGDRIYPERATQDTPTPYIAYHLEIRNLDEPLSAPIPQLELTFMAACFSPDYDQAHAIAELLRTTIPFFKGQMAALMIVTGSDLNEIIGGYEPDLDLFRVDASFSIHYLPA